jgi:hypothetical protein
MWVTFERYLNHIPGALSEHYQRSVFRDYGKCGPDACIQPAVSSYRSLIIER